MSNLLNSTANSAQFEWKWAGLAVLFSRYLQNGTHDFFQIFSICFFEYFIKKPQTTIALIFLTHIISGIDGVRTFVRQSAVKPVIRNYQLSVAVVLKGAAYIFD